MTGGFALTPPPPPDTARAAFMELIRWTVSKTRTEHGPFEAGRPLKRWDCPILCALCVGRAAGHIEGFLSEADAVQAVIDAAGPSFFDGQAGRAFERGRLEGAGEPWSRGRFMQAVESLREGAP